MEGPEKTVRSKPKSVVKKAKGVPLEIKNKRLYWLGVLVAIAVISTALVAFYLRLRLAEVEVKQTESLLVEPGENVEGEEEQLKRAEITLEILNGSGVSGLAGDTADIFEDLGYEDVEVGNADATVGNELYVDPEVEELVEVLLGDVKDELDIESITGDLEGSDFSARIILGS